MVQLARRGEVVRYAMKRVVGTVIAIALASCSGVARDQPASNPSGMLVTVGDVTETTAILWVRARTVAPVAVTISADATQARTVIVEPSAARDLTGRVKLEALTPGSRYVYRIDTDGPPVTGTFVTAPRRDRASRFRLVWSADLGARGFCRRVGTGYAVFDVIAAREPDRFLFLGDTIYADHRCAGDGIVPGADFAAATLPEFHAKHRYNRGDATMQRFFRRTAVWATWDDHDVRSNFSGPAEPLMPLGRQAFLDYWPIDLPAGEPSRLYRRATYGSLVELFLLDTRQYRSGNCRPDRRGKTLLGDRQRSWLIEHVRASQALWKIVGSSVPLSIPKAWPCGDSWAPYDLFFTSTGFGRERDTILRAFRDGGVSNVVFLAGDVHFAMLATHAPWPGFEVHEFIAGPLAARPKRARQPDDTLGTRVLFAAGETPTFGELEVDPGGLTVRIWSGAGELLGTRRFVPADLRRTDAEDDSRDRIQASTLPIR